MKYICIVLLLIAVPSSRGFNITSLLNSTHPKIPPGVEVDPYVDAIVVEVAQLTIRVEEIEDQHTVYHQEIYELTRENEILKEQLDQSDADVQAKIDAAVNDLQANLEKKITDLDNSVAVEISVLTAESRAADTNLQTILETQINELNNAVTFDIAALTSADAALSSDMACIKNSYLNDRFPYDGTEYTVSRYTMTWSAARTYCQNQGGDLIVNGLQDWDQRVRILNYLRLSSGSDYWIGATDSGHEGNWQWIKTPKQGNNFYWASKQPDNAHGNENCAMMSASKWDWKTNDDNCGDSFFAICEHMVDQC